MNYAPAQFVAKRPLLVSQVQANIDHACGLGLPEAVVRRRLDIIANGPSAGKVPWDALQTSMALNGALDLCNEVGHIPTYWAACDPQALVADFLHAAPDSTIYLLSSQCHPDVFARLAGHAHTRLWHVADETIIPGAPHIQRHGSSITLTALMLAPALGFLDVHVWGWDCCVDPFSFAHHASGGSTYPLLEQLDFRPEEDGPILRSFITSASWVYEAQQAEFVIQDLHHHGVTVTVHGSGLVAHTLAFHGICIPPLEP